MIPFERENKSDVGVLVLDGELTVQRADELRAALMNSLSCAGHLVLSFENVTGIDLSCLQLLCAAHRTSAKLNKRLTITGRTPEVFKRAVEDAGYVRHAACIVDEGKGCLWMGGGDG
jgi:anti-anti-sigma regulatory factor